jgi:UPF0176 protein
MQLYNKVDKKVLKERLMQEDFKRVTLSFYRYIIIDNPEELRDELFLEWSDLNCFGRIYLAKEGINAQMSVPEHNWEEFKEKLYARREFKDIPFKVAVEDDGKSFYKLIIKVRKNIVADGLKPEDYDVTNIGKHLSAKEWNEAMDNEDTVVIDMRNHYESEVGHFKGAVTPDCDTFREELPMVLKELEDKKDKKVLLYCTGGIRCEKASAYLKHHGYNDVNQLLGGIIDYKRQIDAEGLDNKFIGKNFVFDERLGERISNEVIAHCHQCGKPCDTHTNCKNDDCHLLFIQCEECAEKYDGCCSKKCSDIIKLPVEEQRKLRKNQNKTGEQRNVYKKGRLRPHLDEFVQNGEIIESPLKQKES